MADVEFGDLRDGGDWLDIFECEAVAGMRLDTVLCGKGYGVGDTAQFDLAFRASQFVSFDPFLLLWDPVAWPRFGGFFLLLAVPFFLSGCAMALP